MSTATAVETITIKCASCGWHIEDLDAAEVPVAVRRHMRYDCPRQTLHGVFGFSPRWLLARSEYDEGGTLTHSAYEIAWTDASWGSGDVVLR